MIFPTAEADTPDWHEPLQLQGFGLTLDPLEISEAEDFLAALGTPEEAAEVLQHLPYHPPDDLAAAVAVISAARATTAPHHVRTAAHRDR